MEEYVYILHNCIHSMDSLFVCMTRPPCLRVPLPLCSTGSNHFLIGVAASNTHMRFPIYLISGANNQIRLKHLMLEPPHTLYHLQWIYIRHKINRANEIYITATPLLVEAILLTRQINPKCAPVPPASPCFFQFYRFSQLAYISAPIKRVRKDLTLYC